MYHSQAKERDGGDMAIPPTLPTPWLFLLICGRRCGCRVAIVDDPSDCGGRTQFTFKPHPDIIQFLRSEGEQPHRRTLNSDHRPHQTGTSHQVANNSLCIANPPLEDVAELPGPHPSGLTPPYVCTHALRFLQQKAIRPQARSPSLVPPYHYIFSTIGASVTEQKKKKARTKNT